MGGSILGSSVKRVEDPRLITGSGSFLDDKHVEGALWIHPVRSPVPHATIDSVDVEATLEAPGVFAVYRSGDLEAGPLPIGAPDLPEMTRRPLIASDKVRFAGDIVAVVVAVDRTSAADAAAMVMPDLIPLPPVATPEQALDDISLLYPDLGTNVVYDRGEPDDRALQDADVVVETRIVNQRLAAVPMESNGALAVPVGNGHVEVWLGSQSAHGHRSALAKTLGIDVSRVHVKVPDIGGGFGAKIPLYPEQALCAAIALKTGRPVRWQETRRENLQAMSQGRDQSQEIRMGARLDGTITGISMLVTQDAGAYPLFGSYLPTFTRRMAAGPYLIPRLEFRWRSVVTNTTPVHAYRGAGRPEATMALERAIDQLAMDLGMDPAEIRRRNFIPQGDFPHVTVSGERYDSGDYQAALELALRMAGYDDLRAAQARRRRDGDTTQLGVGIGSYVEITAAAARKDWGAIDIGEDGDATVYSGALSQGHSHETTFTQLAAAILKLPLERVRFVQGDTDVIAGGGGTMASRSLQMAGSAVARSAGALVEKARLLYSYHAEASPDDVVQFDDGTIGVVGVPASAMSLGQIAALANDRSHLPEDMEPGLRTEDTWEQSEATFPFGTHLSVVEVDTETGDVRVLRHVACDDAGVILNRMVVDGQVHGGVAQGIGQALSEHFRYDETANPVTGNLTTYLIPSAPALPSIEVGHTETETPENALGAKGIGEAGTIGSTPAVVNAVMDALAPYGIRNLDMPLTPGKIWEAIATASTRV